MEREIKVGKLYQHFKGNIYKVICIAMHTETNEDMVVYQDTNDESKIYARPINMFLSEVEKDKYPEVAQYYRFEELNDIMD